MSSVLIEKLPFQCSFKGIGQCICRVVVLSSQSWSSAPVVSLASDMLIMLTYFLLKYATIEIVTRNCHLNVPIIPFRSLKGRCVNVLGNCQSRPYSNNLNLVRFFVIGWYTVLNLGPISGNHYTISIFLFSRDSYWFVVDPATEVVFR